MIKIKEYEVVLWDFDGVIVDSQEVRESGFRMVLSDFPDSEVEALIDFHRANGGLSRYVKFQHFFNQVHVNTNGESYDVASYIQRFGEVMQERMSNDSIIIQETILFIKFLKKEGFTQFVVSGSDQDELRFLLNKFGLSNNFKQIYGSPKSKNVIIGNLIEEMRYESSIVCLIGDSINDYEAAKMNGVDFYGINNVNLRKFGNGYIERLKGW